MITASGTNPHDLHDSANWATLRLRSSARNTTRGRLTKAAGAAAGSPRGTPAGTPVGTPAARHGSARAPSVRALASSASTKNFAAQFGTASSMYFPHIGSDPATPPRSPGSLERITCARFTRSIARSAASTSAGSPSMRCSSSQMRAICAFPVRQAYAAAGRHRASRRPGSHFERPRRRATARAARRATAIPRSSPRMCDIISTPQIVYAMVCVTAVRSPEPSSNPQSSIQPVDASTCDSTQSRCRRAASR